MNCDESKHKRCRYVNQPFEDRSEGRSLIWIDKSNSNYSALSGRKGAQDSVLELQCYCL